jgi:hypothetical protein
MMPQRWADILRAIDQSLGLFDVVYDYHVTDSVTLNEIHLVAEHALQLVKHLDISMEFDLTTNRSKFLREDPHHFPLVGNRL